MGGNADLLPNIKIMDYSESWRARRERLASEEQMKVFNRRLNYLIIWLPVLAVVSYYLLYLFGEWSQHDLPIAI